MLRAAAWSCVVSFVSLLGLEVVSLWGFLGRALVFKKRSDVALTDMGWGVILVVGGWLGWLVLVVFPSLVIL